MMKNIKQNFKENKKTIFTSLVLIALFVLLDQFTKSLMVEYLIKIPSNSVEVFSFFNLALVLNTGVSFGMFAGLSFGKTIISAVAIVITLFLFFLMLKEGRKPIIFAYALVISGAIGNTIDRISLGGVVDFLDFHFKGWHYPAFNVADSLIFVGALTLIFGDLIFKKLFEKQV